MKPQTNLIKLGFRGSLAFVHNEEGSGAKYYNSSCYYPDNAAAPKTNSGITIDPGLDLGSGDRKAIDGALNYYFYEGLLSELHSSASRQLSALNANARQTG